MPIQFMVSPKYLLTSESVTEGHPDKLCDQISDAVLDAALAGDRGSRVACETVATKNLIMVTGEITTASDLDFNDIARQVMQGHRLYRCEVRLGRQFLRRGSPCQQAVPGHQRRRYHRPGTSG